jgi:membrane fusion protein (multidrug efflux system)
MTITAPQKPQTQEPSQLLEKEQKQLLAPGQAIEAPAHENSNDHEDEQKPAVKRRPSPWRILAISAIVLCVGAIGAITGYPSLHEFLSTEQTEDAYVTGHVHPVSSKIAGTIDTVLVKDNQWVEKGQVLATIDPRDVQVDLDKAEAHLFKMQRDAIAAKHVVAYAARNKSAVSENANGSIGQAQNSIIRAEAGIPAAKAGVEVAKQKLVEREAELHKAKLDLGRYTALASEGAVKLESLDAARKDYDVARAARDAAVESVGEANSKLDQAYADLKISKSQLVNANSIALQADAADAQISVNAEQEVSSRAAIKEALADVESAKLRLSYTKILAPIAGRIGKKTVEEGQRIQPGTALLAVVSKDKWIVANFKETQLKDMRVGQIVKIGIDAFGGREFTGRVESFSPASGASFALLPPDNATGNFTKIVQRVPVKIVFDQDGLRQFEQLIGPGMSCDVKVWVR